MLEMPSALAQGKVVFEGEIFSHALKTNRKIRIYLPPSYDQKPRQRYPVLYVHDGQNAFSTAGPHAAFGWGNWQLDTTVTELARAGKMQEIIMVAIDCSKDRYREYRGRARTNSNSPYELYSQFLREELKPKIDREFRTKTEAKNTGVIGSSMGGICSLALAWDAPETFGLAASLSGAFQVEKQLFIRDVLGAAKRGKKGLKIYLDNGVTDYTGGDDGWKETEAVAQELRRLGWRDGKTLLYYVDAKPLGPEQLAAYHLAADKFKEAQRSQHNELYWRLRAWRALTFLFPKE